MLNLCSAIHRNVIIACSYCKMAQTVIGPLKSRLNSVGFGVGTYLCSM